LQLRDGLVTDPTLSVGVPGMFAAGDVTRWVNPCFAEEMRVEHWTNADEQGALAAGNLLTAAAGGDAVAHDTVPYVWSDQYHHRVQVVGRTTAADGSPAAAEIVVGSAAARRFLAVFHADGRLRGALALDLPRLLMRYRALIARRAPIGEALALAAEQRTALSATGAAPG
jgi:NADPH-dependent 2,4-dienoyl-CoA reductase/sulfur reductase-like enzyme